MLCIRLRTWGRSMQRDSRIAGRRSVALPQTSFGVDFNISSGVKLSPIIPPPYPNPNPNRSRRTIMSAVVQPQPINEDKMNAFLGKVVGDFGASLSSALVYIGQKLGLYKTLADAGPATPAELAQRTNTNERYVREWLINQASGGYVEYDTATGRYHLTPEQAVALTDEHSPFYVGGGFFVIKAMTGAVSRIEDHFRNGGGMLWGEHDPDLFIGTERLFRPGYSAHLVATWIPSLTGIEAKLKD